MSDYEIQIRFVLASLGVYLLTLAIRTGLQCLQYLKENP